MKFENVKALIHSIGDGNLFVLRMQTNPNGLTAQAKRDGYSILKETTCTVMTGVPYVPKEPKEGEEKKEHTPRYEAIEKDRLYKLIKDNSKIYLMCTIDEDSEFISSKKMVKNGEFVEWDESKCTKPTKHSYDSKVMTVNIDNIVSIDKIF